MREHRATVGVVFLIVFIDLVGFGIVIPILPLYAEDLHGSPLELGLLMAAFSAMQFVFAPILGRLSDRFGRRPVLLLSLLGSVVGYVLFGLAGSMAMLFASRIVDGISGANVSTAQAVIADITGPEDRARGMGLVGMAFGLGFVFGPAVGGTLVGIAEWLPGFAAAGMSALAFVLAWWLLPETLSPEARERARRTPLDLRALARAVAHPNLGLALAAVFLVIFAFANFETTFAQLARLRLGLGKRGVAYLFVYVGVLAAAVQGGLVGRLARRLGEGRLVAAGTFTAFLTLGFLPYLDRLGPVLVTLAALALGQGLAGPSLSALTSKLVGPDEVGGVMGIYQSLSSLGRIVGPFYGELVYGALGFHWPYRTGSLFMLAAAALGTVLAVRLTRARAAPA